MTSEKAAMGAAEEAAREAESKGLEEELEQADKVNPIVAERLKELAEKQRSAITPGTTPRWRRRASGR